MKRLTTILFIVAFAAVSSVMAQAPVLHAVSAAGGQVSSAGYVVGYTIGQAAAAKLEGEHDMNEGVQQFFCIPTFDTIRPVLCQNSEYDFGGFTEASTAMPGYFEYRYNGVNLEGCDSVVWLELTVKPVSDTDLYDQASNSYVWLGTEYTESGTYKQVLTNYVGCDSTIYMHLAIIVNKPIPHIYSYEDKIVMVAHTTTVYENVEYASYRWFKDGEEIPNSAGKDFYQLANNQSLSGCYYVMVPTDHTMTVWVKSNELCFNTQSVEDIAASQVSLSIAPNPIAVGHTLHVDVEADEADLNGAKLVIYDIQGRRVLESAAQRENTLQINFASGVYSVHVLFANGLHDTRKLVVR